MKGKPHELKLDSKFKELQHSNDINNKNSTVPEHKMIWCDLTKTQPKNESPCTVTSIWIHVSLSLQWRHNERDGVSNHRCLECLLNRVFWRRSKTSKLPVTDLREGNSPVTGEFPTQRASNAENVRVWCRHQVLLRSPGKKNPALSIAVGRMAPTSDYLNFGVKLSRVPFKPCGDNPEYGTTTDGTLAMKIKCNSGTHGRYVYLYNNDQDPATLTLCEIFIDGTSRYHPWRADKSYMFMCGQLLYNYCKIIEKIVDI